MLVFLIAVVAVIVLFTLAPLIDLLPSLQLHPSNHLRDHLHQLWRQPPTYRPRHLNPHSPPQSRFRQDPIASQEHRLRRPVVVSRILERHDLVRDQAQSVTQQNRLPLVAQRCVGHRAQLWL
ncbi:hypothetical protein EJ03DRAFT_328178 [Teratosphaeria nubilosa]|uniref:Uncharacterized protein n=1 Tax=Teratosphaeria nubilosa TaxID=161662 RepID=A0A6G1L6L4_9PEZI|nr:hypothetical protein EJ03DRAFT_328178 [Teratosphaeria nubilosa]